MIKKIALALLAVLVIIQFFRPEKNDDEIIIAENDITKKYNTPEVIHQILVTKCYDCHSNSTEYPWYANIQPIAWWMANHINEGKRELNFSIFKTYPEKRANHKMEELLEVVNDGSMPIDSYLWMHGNAKLTEQDKSLINAWVKTLPVVFEEHKQ